MATVKVNLLKYRRLKEASLVGEGEISFKITQASMAKIMGVCRQTYLAWETGEYPPPLTDALKLAKFFGCTVDDLFKYEE